MSAKESRRARGRVASAGASYVRAFASGRRGDVAIDRAEARNAIDGAGWRGLIEAVRRHAADPTVRVLVLRSEGSVFCAGGELPWMRGADQAELMLVDEALEAIRACPKPVVARVHAPAFGGGVGLAAACDVVVAARDARFVLSEVRVAVAPAIVSRFVIERIGGARFRSWALTAEAVEAEDAYVAGLVDRLAEPDEIDDAVSRVVTALSAGEPEALAATKRLFPSGLAAGPAVAELARLRARAEFAEGIAALREKRPASWVPR
jgi:methylglutaconyl-CoA hydratase